MSTDTPPTGETIEKPPFEFPPSLAATVGLLVAALAAVGLSGDLLSRAVRTYTWPLAGLFALAIMITSFAVAVTNKGRAARVAVILLAVIAALLVVTGAFSVDTRDVTAVSVTYATGTVPDKGGEQLTTITVGASGSGVRVGEFLWLEVYGLPPDVSWSDPRDPCSRADEVRPMAVRVADLTAGPDQSGAVTTQSGIDIPTGTYVGICAYTGLISTDMEKQDFTNASAYARLAHTR